MKPIPQYEDLGYKLPIIKLSYWENEVQTSVRDLWHEDSIGELCSSGFYYLKPDYPTAPLIKNMIRSKSERHEAVFRF